MSEFDELQSAADTDRLMLEDPDRAFKLLQAYYILLGDPRPWWRVTQYGDESAWPSAVKAAILDTARKIGISAPMFAQALDEVDLTHLRARVLHSATARFERGLR